MLVALPLGWLLRRNDALLPIALGTAMEKVAILFHQASKIVLTYHMLSSPPLRRLRGLTSRQERFALTSPSFRLHYMRLSISAFLLLPNILQSEQICDFIVRHGHNHSLSLPTLPGHGCL